MRFTSHFIVMLLTFTLGVMLNFAWQSLGVDFSRPQVKGSITRVEPTINVSEDVCEVHSIVMHKERVSLIYDLCARDLDEKKDFYKDSEVYFPHYMPVLYRASGLSCKKNSYHLHPNEEVYVCQRCEAEFHRRHPPAY